MQCQKCQNKAASVHITVADPQSAREVKHHFCHECADAFRATDPLFQAANVTMIDLRIVHISDDRTQVKVIDGTTQPEDWIFLTSRLRQLYPTMSEGKEFGIQNDASYIDWLKGNREAPE